MRLFAFIFFAFLVMNPARATIELYTVDDGDHPRPVADMYYILKEFKDKYSEKNILFYVHGRKRLVSDEIKRIKGMEERYGMKIVMLHWDSYQTLITRPVENASIASDSLYESFEEIKRFRNDYPEHFKDHSLNLLCHSMGNLVLKYTVEKYYMNTEIKEKIFNHYISVGADVPLTKHKVWLSKFNLAQQNFIMMNNRDIVLLLSYALDMRFHNPFTYRLGLGFDNIVGLKEHVMKNLEPNTKYIDLSKVLVADHGYFMSDNKIMRYIFNSLLNGYDFTDEKSAILKMKLSQHKKHTNVYSVGLTLFK